MQPTVTLTQDLIDFYHREGYLAIDALTTPDDVAEIREMYDRMFARRAGRERGDQFDLAGADEEGKEAALPQILNPAFHEPGLMETQLLVNATAVGKQLLGDEAKTDFAHAIFKPAQHGAATPWHQDGAYSSPNRDPRALSIWVPLQEANETNGCMHFVPRSQNLDMLNHQPIGNDPRVHGLELTPDEMHHVKDAVACPLPPGGATFHGRFMLHYTPANQSDVPRRALILFSQLPPIERKTPRHMPWLEQRQTAREQRRTAATRRDD